VLVRYLLPALVAVSLAFAVLHMEMADRKPPQAALPAEPARSPYARTVAGVGLVEPETEIIAVGTPISGVVKAVHVRVDDRVAAGGRLFELDDRHLAAELAAREAARDSAAAQLARLDALPRKEEMAPLEARVAEAKTHVADKEKLFERAKRETASGVGSEEAYDVRKAALDVARTQLRRAQAEFDLAAAGVWAHDRTVARSGLTEAQARCDQARAEMGRLRVDAPRVCRPGADHASDPVPDADLVQFRVLRVNVRPGESVGAASGQPAVVLGTVGPLHVRVDIDEADIPRFRPGAPGVASPRGDSGQRIPLRFVRVEPHVIAKRSLSGDSIERVDTRVLQVIYAIDATDPSLHVGQQLDVFLDAGRD
jgi:multidrug efflux pump subunit AcrA (membrane-fusion protein)